MVWSKWDLGWPWFCLGGGVVLCAVLFWTNVARSDQRVSRWWDPVWLAWLAVPMLMVHMFEEYGFDILGRTYFFPEMMCQTLGYPPYPACPMPIAHYPFLNIGVAWVAAPLAAFLARRNLVIGLSLYGLLLVNGIGHVVGTLARGTDAASGVVTGALFFIPSFCWMVWVVVRSGALSGKELAVSVSAGAIAHILLVVVIVLFRSGAYGGTGLILFDLVVIAAPVLLGWVGSKLLGPPPLATTSA